MSKPSVVVFDPDCAAALVDHAVEGMPAEVCGVLGGNRADDEFHIECSIRVTNTAETPRSRYRLDPAEHLAAMERIEEADREVVGFYHSHPDGPPTPSPIDRADATWPGALYVIVAPNNEPVIGAWRWEGTAECFESLAVRRGRID